MNQCNFVGKIGKIEKRTHIPSGDYYIFSVAISHKEKEEYKTSWLSCVAFGHAGKRLDGAEVGDGVFVSASYKVEEYIDKNNEKRQSHKFFVNECFISKKQEKQAQQITQPVPKERGLYDDIRPEDLPF